MRFSEGGLGHAMPGYIFTVLLVSILYTARLCEGGLRHTMAEYDMLLAFGCKGFASVVGGKVVCWIECWSSGGK